MNIRPVPSQSQESLETAAQTKAEAANGDQQAVQKLARQSPQQPPAEAPAITVKGSRAHLNTKA